MTEHSHELHYQSIWFIQLQHYSDCHLQIVERKTLYFLHHWWWRYHSWKDSWNVASINILNSRFIKLHCIQSRFSVHLHSLKVSLQMTEHFSLIVHRLSSSDQWSKRTSQSECRVISLFLLFIHAEWLVQVTILIEFVNNNILSSVIFLILFFMNKNFHSHMSFNFDIIEYESTRERLQIAQVEDIFDHMNKTLIFAREALIKTRKQMMNQANKHRKKINYEIESKMFLNERNIVTARLFKKLNDKMLNSFKVKNSVDWFYKLKLSETMHIHDIFHSELLRSAVNDSLSDQKNEPSKSIVVNDEDEWEIDDILNSWWYWRWLQYQVKWKSYDNDLNWYNADDNEFMNAQEMIDEFHIRYSRKAH